MSLSDLSLPTENPPPKEHVMAAAGLMGLKLFQAWTARPVLESQLRPHTPCSAGALD